MKIISHLKVKLHYLFSNKLLKTKISDYEMNYLKDDDSYLLDKHVYQCFDFSEGFGIVWYKNYKRNFVNSDGKPLLKNNVDYCYDFYKGFARIIIYDNCLIDKNCNFYNMKKVSFKELYKLYPHMRSELIEIIDKYTYFDVNEYFL